MSDSVDRVFVHALNTVKRIPRTGSARPPPADRLRLYGLYKQSTEGDVDGVMLRPRGDTEEIVSDQEKWDSWNLQKGLSRTEAKRQYISTLIETMHRYASQTRDARELVSELEFVWDQIKSNSPSSSSSHSYPPHSQVNGSGESPSSGRDQLIYPVMSEGGARNPGARREKALRTLDPVSQHSSSHSEEADGQEEDEQVADGREEFVDAQDSQMDDHEGRPESPEQPVATPHQRARNLRANAEGLIAPIANYLKGQTQKKEKPPDDSNSKWQKRIETALIKMNAEMAALREQLEMQQDAAVHSSVFRRFSLTTRRKGFVPWLLESVWGATKTVAKYALFNALLIAAVSLWMHYNDIPTERLEQFVAIWIGRFRRFTLVRKLERTGARYEINRIPANMAKAVTFRPIQPRPGG